jgi:homoserine O-succinyltransferase
MPARWRVPHSRLNTLPADPLSRAGYEILSSSAEIGVDMFARRGASLFLFLQGHPEYDAAALLREYQRDIARWLTGKSDRYPDLPSGYLRNEVVAGFDAFRHEATANRRPDLVAAIPNAAEPARPWRDPGVRLYANWLSYLSMNAVRR